MALKNQSTGLWGEQLAKSYLHQKGLRVVTQRYRCRAGEIDLIMRHKRTLVFVEVRLRKDASYGFPEETVSFAKQQRLISTALYFQAYHPHTQKQCCRFDIVGILGNELDYKIKWIPNAFGMR